MTYAQDLRAICDAILADKIGEAADLAATFYSRPGYLGPGQFEGAMEHGVILELGLAVETMNAFTGEPTGVTDLRDRLGKGQAVTIHTPTGPGSEHRWVVAPSVILDALDAERFRPMGDNHHNALACPHCAPRGGRPGQDAVQHAIFHDPITHAAYKLGRQEGRQERRL